MNKRIWSPGAITQLTEAEREDLARKNREQNQRSESSAAIKRG
ncbi:hypothetical protein [Streptomyces mordarskii]|uniref:Uncharacterized protein n=1 Tax=Streptomyces mordarskii TaxID=1226758 RepID=A0ABN1E0K2_9ACTN